MYQRSFDDRKLAAFLQRGIKGGGGVHNVMTRQLCGCLGSPELAECGHGAWRYADCGSNHRLADQPTLLLTRLSPIVEQ